MEGTTRTSSEQSCDASIITDIPDHILTDIFARLSVKSVCRCRSVCKHWFKALTDTTFIKLHHERAPIYPLLEDRSGYSNSNSKSLYLFEIERDDRYFDDHGNLEFDTVFKLPAGENPLGMDIVNSCNGFLCLKGVHNTRLFVIYNPVTGEYLILPKPFDDDKKIFAFFLHGLGFCSTSNQYKVLLTATENSHCKSCVDSNSPDCRSRTAFVYTLGGGWRKVVGKVPCFYCSTNGNSVIVNGALLWHVSDRRWDCNNVMSFDLEGEKFCSLAMPELSYKGRERGMAGYRLLRLRLGVIRGQLYLVHVMDIPRGGSKILRRLESRLFEGRAKAHRRPMVDPPLDIPRAKFEQWVMKDYGVGNSWTKDLLADVSATGENGASRLHDGLCQSIDIASSWDFFFSSWNDKRIHFIAGKHRKTWCLNIWKTQTAYKVVAFVPSFYSLKDIAAGSSEIFKVR